MLAYAGHAALYAFSLAAGTWMALTVLPVKAVASKVGGIVAAIARTIKDEVFLKAFAPMLVTVLGS